MNVSDMKAYEVVFTNNCGKQQAQIVDFKNYADTILTNRVQSLVKLNK